MAIWLKMVVNFTRGSCIAVKLCRTMGELDIIAEYWETKDINYLIHGVLMWD